MSIIRLAIAEDNGKFLRLIRGFNETSHDIQVVIQTDSGDQLLDLLKIIPVDIILLDICRSGTAQIETLKLIKRLHPDSKIVAFSQHFQEASIVEMITQGVKCLVDNESDSDKLFKAIQIVFEGGVYITDYPAKIVQSHLAKTNNSMQLPSISDAEKKLIKMIIDGLTSKQIGEKLYKSHRTIDDMREKLYRKFDVTNKVELIRIALKYEL